MGLNRRPSLIEETAGEKGGMGMKQRRVRPRKRTDCAPKNDVAAGRVSVGPGMTAEKTSLWSRKRRTQKRSAAGSGATAMVDEVTVWRGKKTQVEGIAAKENSSRREGIDMRF